MNGFEINSFLGVLLSTLRRRWWIVPLCMTISTALLFAQASGLDKNPSRIAISHSFQGRDSKPLLSALKIDPSSLSSVPNLAGAVAILQSFEFKTEMKSKVDVEADLLVYTRENDISMECYSDSLANCRSALSFASNRLEELRNFAMRENLGDVADVLAINLESVKRLIPLVTDSDQITELRLREIDLTTKIESLRQLEKNEFFKLFFSGEQILEEATTIYSVSAQTYALGAIIGGVVGFLLLAQLALNSFQRRQYRDPAN